MEVKLEVRPGKGYHNLEVDGRIVAGLWGDVGVTGHEVEGRKQVCVNSTNCFLWVDKIEYVEEKEVTETEEVVVNGR